MGKVYPVILCGGSGTRLWPVSREAFPKQFAPIIGNRSTFQQTMQRVSGDDRFGRALIVTNRAHRFLVEQQLREVGLEADLLIEPIARDSGPAIIAGSLFIQDKHPDGLALILAADHLVRDIAKFRQAVADGIPAARAGHIVTFGIVPTHPATGYGYIEPGAGGADGARPVVRFVEKPDAPTALDYIQRGYLWNSGNFLFDPAAAIAEYGRQDPAGVETVHRAIREGSLDLGALEMNHTAFEAARKISFDFAVMEKTTGAAVIPGDFGWSDIGGWDALWDLADKDPDGNAATGDVVFVDSRNSFASTDGPLVAVLGVEDAVVVSTRDAVLVTQRSRAGDVKKLVDALRARNRIEATQSARVYRPWGWYQTLELQARFQVKRIVVYPGGRLSLQKHFHRSEHWVVVKGTARVTVEDRIDDLTENQSIYVPLGAVHRLENPGKIETEIIEIQTGSYLGEDDIVRLEDDYRRM